MAVKDIREIFETNLKEAQIDKGKGIIRNVAILGQISRNGRFYSDKSMEQVAQMTDSGVKSFCDHGDLMTGQSVLKLLGQFSNGRKEGSRVYADLSVLREAAGREIIFDIVENSPEISVGFSLACRAKVASEKDSEGRDVIESVENIYSVDFVANPASVSSLWESDDKKDLEAEIKLLQQENSQLKEKVEDHEDRLESLEDRIEEIEDGQISSEGKKMTDEQARKILWGDTFKQSEKIQGPMPDDEARKKLLDAFLPENKQVYEA